MSIEEIAESREKQDSFIQAVVYLRLDRQINGEFIKGKDLRGAIANFYPEKRLLHQHRVDGKTNYSYPLVQYKIIDDECLLVGFKEGAKLLSSLDLVMKVLSLGSENYNILSKEMRIYHVSMGITEILQHYHLLTPWLALNERNYEKYQGLENWTRKKEFLAKILIGNIISMSKGIGYTVPEPIKASIGHPREIKTSLKGTPMLGFLGTFSVNFEIPDYWGIGKSVSRGFGTVVRQSTDNRRQR